MWRFGEVVEQRLGQRAFVVTFVVGGALGNLLFAWADGRAHVGATASLFALQGAAFAERREALGRWFNRENGQLLLSFGIEVALVHVCEAYLFGDFMADVQISYYGHFGGFLAGIMVMEAMLELRHRTRSEYSTYGVAALSIAVLALATFYLFCDLASSGSWVLVKGLLGF